jgi:hypothetical protein
VREGIGSVALYNIIMVFLIITFSFLSATISYSKAFRVNTNIVNAMEIFEGYNTKSIAEVDRVLMTIGYRVSNTFDPSTCPLRRGVAAEVVGTGKYEYCVYVFSDGGNYYHYGILSYMYFDVPIVADVVKIPIYMETDSYYRFPTSFGTAD